MRWPGRSAHPEVDTNDRTYSGLEAPLAKSLGQEGAPQLSCIMSFITTNNCSVNFIIEPVTCTFTRNVVQVQFNLSYIGQSL